MKKAASNENLSGKPTIPSEKHDMLYSKARYVLNQRHIKRPWFNLNPFLERTDESADLENWFPGESKYIQPLESLVLCESFHIDYPVDTRELSIEAFFPYLLSEEWNKGCSVRVLEGQLLDHLLIGLYRLEKEDIAVRHTTYAFARNSRPRTGCYKLTDKESSGSIDETLLLEFAYFGRLTKDQQNPKTLNPFEYLEREKTDLDELMELSQEIEETVSELPTVLETNKPRNRAMSLGTDTMKSQNGSKPKGARRGSLVSKHVDAIGYIAGTQTRRQSIAAPFIPENRRQSMTSSAFPKDDRRQSLTTNRNQETRRQSLFGTSGIPEHRRHTIYGQVPAPDGRRPSLQIPSVDKTKGSTRPVSEKRRESERFSQAYDDDASKYAVPKASKNRFLSKVYSLDFDEDYKSEDTDNKRDKDDGHSSDENDDFFGEELYLSNQKGIKSGKVVSARKLLQRKKRDLQKLREEARQMTAERSENQKVSRLPLKFPELENVDSCRVKYETIKMPDHVPTLEEFIQILKEDEYYDPRYRNKMRQKSKRIAQRYYMAKGTHRSTVVFSLGNLPDDIKHLTALHNVSRKSLASPLKKRESKVSRSKCQQSRMPTLQESGQFLRKRFQAPESKPSAGNIQERAHEVLVVTDSEPCKDHYIKQRRQSLAGANLGGSGRQLNHGNSSDKVTPASPMFPKLTMCEDESESSDTESEESEESISEDELPDDFDTKKLNIRYSIERLRKKRRGKAKKKPAFIEVLAKYYNMQNALRAFRKGSAGKETKRARARAKMLGKKMKQQSAQESQEEKMVIGKLKKFSFLEAKPKKKLNLDNLPRGDFTSPDLAKFHQQLKEVLDKFVIRRELVVSDLQTFYNATTSVTFTKGSCFQLKDKSHQH